MIPYPISNQLSRDSNNNTLISTPTGLIVKAESVINTCLSWSKWLKILRSYIKKGLFDGIQVNIPKIDKEMEKHSTVSEKLNYWKKIYEDNFKQKLKNSDIPWDHRPMIENHLLIVYFNGINGLYTPLYIPHIIFDIHIRTNTNTAEYSFWFLKYHAEEYLPHIIEYKNLKEKLASALAAEHIKAELHKINQTEQLANELLNNAVIDNHQKYSVSPYEKEIELLRLLDGYYTRHVLPEVHTIGNRTVEIYASQILLKNYLEKELSQIEVNFCSEGVPKKIIDTLKLELNRYDFNSLIEIKDIGEKKRNKVLNLIITNDVPYQIAMLDHLGFIKHLDKNYCTSKDELQKLLAKILATGQRNVKGNILVLNPISREDRSRYTAHAYKEIVQNDFNRLK